MLVLIVEDNPLIALDLCEIVLETATHADIVMSGTIASTQKVMQRPFDFAFFDVDLPDGKTYGLVSEMLSRNIPLVFVSGSSVRDLPAELQGVPFIAKPFRPGEIARVMKDVPDLLH